MWHSVGVETGTHPWTDFVLRHVDIDLKNSSDLGRFTVVQGDQN